MSALLQATGMSVSFGGVRAVDDVDIGVGGKVRRAHRAERRRQDDLHRRDHRVRPRARAHRLDGTIGSRAPRARPARARAHLAVDRAVRGPDRWENLLVAAYASVWRPSVRWCRRGAAREERGARVLGLSRIAESSADAPQGQRKLVGVARALAAKPRLLRLDEPAAGLDTTRAGSSARLRRVVDAGTAMLLIDHDMGLVLSICDYIYVLEFGDVIARGTRTARADPPVIKAYLGSAAKGAAGGRGTTDVLELDGVPPAMATRGHPRPGHDGRRGEVVALLGQRRRQDDHAARDLGDHQADDGTVLFTVGTLRCRRRRPGHAPASPMSPRAGDLLRSHRPRALSAATAASGSTPTSRSSTSPRSRVALTPRRAAVGRRAADACARTQLARRPNCFCSTSLASASRR